MLDFPEVICEAPDGEADGRENSYDIGGDGDVPDGGARKDANELFGRVEREAWWVSWIRQWKQVEGPRYAAIVKHTIRSLLKPTPDEITRLYEGHS